jgi:hypothetical protein
MRQQVQDLRWTPEVVFGLAHALKFLWWDVMQSRQVHAAQQKRLHCRHLPAQTYKQSRTQWLHDVCHAHA